MNLKELLRMNLKEKKNLVIQLHQEGKTQREIAQVAHMSVRDISKIIRKIEGITEEKSVEIQALDLFYQGKKPIEIAVELNLNAQKTSKLYKDYLKLEGFHLAVHNLILQATGGDQQNSFHSSRLLNRCRRLR